MRELRNVLERAAVLCDGGLIAADHLALTQGVPHARASTPSEASDSAPAPASTAAPRPVPEAVRPPAGKDLKSVERVMIEKALSDARFNESRAAKSARADARPALRAHETPRRGIDRRPPPWRAIDKLSIPTQNGGGACRDSPRSRPIYGGLMFYIVRRQCWFVVSAAPKPARDIRWGTTVRAAGLRARRLQTGKPQTA